MRNNLNVIQIRGIRGLIIAGVVVCCLAAGFIVFPGWVAMHLWNITASYIEIIPAIGLIQGVLLWGILIAAYFTFRKNKVVVCLKSPKGLDEEELKEVFADIKRQSVEDPVLQAMLKAREAELNIIKNEKTEDKDESSASDSHKV